MPPSKGSRRAPERRNLTPADVSRIVSLIESWPETRITWPLLVRHVEGFVGHAWTRQALERHEAIKAAYQAARDGRRGTAVRRGSGGATEEVLLRRVESLQGEIDRLKQQIATYQERFVRYEYNAHSRGISPAELGMPLSSIDRGRTDT